MSHLLGIVQAGIGVVFTAGMLVLLGTASSFGAEVGTGRSALLLICPLLLIAGGVLYTSPKTTRWGIALSAAGSAGVSAMVILLLYSLAMRTLSYATLAIVAVVLLLVALSGFVSLKMIR